MKTVVPTADLNRKHLIGGVSALVFAVLLSYGPVLHQTAKQWLTNPDYSHGFLVPIFSAWLIWRKKNTLHPRNVEPNLLGLIVLIPGLILFALGKTGNLVFLMGMSFIIVLLGLCLFVLGAAICKSVLFPLGYLIFMIPLPSVLYNDITFRLTILSSVITSKLLSLSGISVARAGSIIHLSHVSLQVVDACSGLRSLMSLLTLALLFAYLTQRSTWRRLCLVFVTVPIAVIANSCRLTLTAVFVNYFGPGATEGFLHIFTGIMMWGIALILLLGCGVFLKGTD